MPKISIHSNHENIFLGIIFFEKLMIKLYFYLQSNFIYLSSQKNSGGIDVFSVNQLENDKTSGNMESSAYC